MAAESSQRNSLFPQAEVASTYTNQVDLVKEANLLPPKHGSSLAWKFFGFKQEDGVVKDHSHVSYRSPACLPIIFILFCFVLFLFEKIFSNFVLSYLYGAPTH